MEVDTTSVSNGVFLCKNGFKLSKRKVQKEKSLFSSNLWYEHYESLELDLESDLEALNKEIFRSVLGKLVEFIEKCHSNDANEIPTAVLFTGINMPDHTAQFDSLKKQVKKKVTPLIACLQSQDGQNIKSFMENVIGQFANQLVNEYNEENTLHTGIKKNQLSLPLLQCLYDDVYKAQRSKKLVVIIPDFESFNIEVLKKFILIIENHIKSLPFVLVLGVATDINALNKSLPYKVFSKIRVKVFHSQKSVEYLNNVLEKVIFKCPFQLGGNVFNLFTELFLFYDLSVCNFIQNFKYAMLDHCAQGNMMSLCTFTSDVVEENISEFTSEDLKSIKELPSFKSFFENQSKEEQIKLLVDDVYFAEVLLKKIQKLQYYIESFHLYLKLLLILVEDLPRAPLGTQLRELYATATCKYIIDTTEYKECMKLLNFLSKDDLSEKISKIIILLENNENTEFLNVLKKCQGYLNKLSDYEQDQSMSDEKSTVENPVQLVSASSRSQFREKLIELTKTPNKAMNKYEKLRHEIIDTFTKVFEEKLRKPESMTFHEIFFNNNMSVKNYIVGSHRSAVHNALNDPHFYLRCSCCELANSSSIKPTMPDICVAYKLHLEYGKMINLYDWLQSFISILDPDVNMGDEQFVVRPEMQARFTQAIAELELLGFIKSSKRKPDHVQRLTWGG